MMDSTNQIIVLDGHALNPGDLSWEPLDKFGRLTVYPRTSEEDVVSCAAEANIVLTNKTRLSEQVLRKLPKLRFISVLATGYNVIDIRAAENLGIAVSNVPTYGTSTVAQHTFALILELCHHVGLHNSSVHVGEWSRSPDFCYWKQPLIELEGKQLGIVGRGRIGQRVAQIARGFGMEAVFASCTRPQGGEGLLPLQKLFETSDIISLHCAMTVSNQHFVNRDLLQVMKPSAFLVNTARGALIEEADLAEALGKGSLAGAALDVLSTEPPPAVNPLLSAPRCILTPHMAWTGQNARKRLLDVTVENVAAFLKGSPIHVVNNPVRPEAPAQTSR